MPLVEVNMVIGAIVEMGAEGIWDHARRREAIMRALKKIKMADGPPDREFSTLYRYSLVLYGIDKPKPVLELFRHDFIQEAYHQAFEQRDLKVLENEAEHLVQWHDVGQALRRMDIDPRSEFRRFEAVFHEVVRSERNPLEIQRDHKLDDLQTGQQQLLGRVEAIVEQLRSLPSLEAIQNFVDRLQNDNFRTTLHAERNLGPVTQIGYVARDVNIFQGGVPADPRERELKYLDYILAVDETVEAGAFYYPPSARARVMPELTPEAGMVQNELAARRFSRISARIHTKRGHSPDDDGATSTVENYGELSEALDKFDRVAIIGDPGSGKTTTLRRLTYDLAKRARQDENAPLPVFVPLGGFRGGDLAAYIQACFAGQPLLDYLPRRVVVLLDGLNETPHEYVPAVQRWLDDNGGIPVRLTCRKLDYIDRRLDLQRVDVLPLDLPRIYEFMAAQDLADDHCDALFWGLVPEDLRAIWHTWRSEGRSFHDFWFGGDVPGSTSTAQDKVLNQARADLRNEAAPKYPGLLGLVRNPYLLTITIAIYLQSDGQVPRNRAGLFADFIAMLFAERGQPAAERAGFAWLDEAVQLAALKHLAYQMQWQNIGTVAPYSWARDVLTEVYPDPDHLLYLAASTSIIDKGAQDVRFTHQLLQEYFAALQLRERAGRDVQAPDLWPGGRWWETTGWEETVLLLAEMTPAEEGGAAKVAGWLAGAHPLLACHALSNDDAKPTGPVADQVRGRLVAAMTGDAPPESRAEAGRVINRLGDPRPGVLVDERSGLPDVLHADYWREVPEGVFKMGSTDADGQASDNEKPQIKVPADTFYMARYAVTNAQFAVFIADPQGYNNRVWWTEAGWADKGDRTAPEEYDDPDFRLPNHPRIYVRWYEALAYTRWLEAQLGAQVRALLKLPEDWIVRLPTEAEWEKAARGTGGRIYPYGNEFDANRGNVDETGIGRTSAVGIFPGDDLPYGLLDMSGNVWEWTATKLDENYDFWNYADGPGSMDNDLEGTNVRVLRGGSWLNSQRDARAAYRDSRLPNNRYLAQGFRLCVGVPPISMQE